MANIFKKKKKQDVPLNLYYENDYYENLKVEEPTILQVIENCTSAIRDKLKAEDCDEVVTIHVSKKVGYINLRINNEDYVWLGSEWKQI